MLQKIYSTKMKVNEKSKDGVYPLFLLLLSCIVLFSAIIVNFGIGDKRFLAALDVYLLKSQTSPAADTNAAALFGGTK